MTLVRDGWPDVCDNVSQTGFLLFSHHGFKFGMECCHILYNNVMLLHWGDISSSR